MMTEALDPSRRNEVGIFEQIEKLPPTTFEEKRGLHFSSVLLYQLEVSWNSCMSSCKLVTKRIKQKMQKYDHQVFALD